MILLSANLKAFLAVVKTGTVVGAAKEIHLTQTGVTQRILSLEKELGSTLFLRSRKGMQLTPEGDALVRYCRGVEDLDGHLLVQIMGAAKDTPVDVTIAGPTSVMTARIVGQCQGLYAQFPRLQLHFNIIDSELRINLVRKGEVCLSIVRPDQVPNEMDSKVLKPEKYILVASPKWKHRKLSEILENERIIDFNENDPTTLNYLKTFNLRSRNPRIFLNNNEAIAKYFSLGIGFGTLTQEIAKPLLDSKKLITLNGGSVMEEPLALAWYPRPQMPSYLKAIIAAIH